MSEFIELFQPGMRYRREQQDFEKVHVVLKEVRGRGPQPIDLESGRIVINVPRNPPEALAAIERSTEKLGFDGASSREVGALLAALARRDGTRHVLELGTGTGLATAWLLDGMAADAHLTSVELDARAQNVARRHLGDDDRLELVLADGADWLTAPERADEQYDLVFADTWPGKFDHLDETLALVAPGGTYLVDDLLPQPNWPDGHQASVDALMDHLHALDGWSVQRHDWATGIAAAVRWR